MSIDGNHIPDVDQIDYHASHHEERRRRALAKIHPEDLLAAVMEELAEQPLQGHALEPMILWLLDKAWTPGDGGVLWDRLKQAVLAQIERALEAVLADPHAWED
jgi:hypothetical protein